MFKRLVLVVLVSLIASTCYGAAIDNCVAGNYLRVTSATESSGRVLTTPPSNVTITSNTVSFNTVRTIVTFNSAISEITLVNESTASPVHISLTPTTEVDVKLQDRSTVGAFKLTAGSSITIPIQTSKIGYITSATNSGSLNYVAVSESTTRP